MRLGLEIGLVNRTFHLDANSVGKVRADHAALYDFSGAILPSLGGAYLFSLELVDCVNRLERLELGFRKFGRRIIHVRCKVNLRWLAHFLRTLAGQQYVRFLIIGSLGGGESGNLLLTQLVNLEVL